MLRTVKTATLLLPFLLLVTSCANQAERIPRLTDKVSFEPYLAESVTEGRRTVRGQISLDTPHEHFFDLETKALMSETLSVGLSGKKKDLPPLDPAKSYKVELLTRIYAKPDHVFDDLLRISLNGRVIHDESVCAVHQSPMEHGMWNSVSREDYPGPFLSLQEKQFPNDGNTYERCGSGIRHPKWKCPDCHAAYLRAEKRFNIPKY
ncbi:MAG: hypothetical protein EOP88_13220 [Verrucomicrobiaceae bacterium]|nr:MAG: hypothetical protein EOP88_13220 [Verrucomicrobiaceae bacterium]